jgi:hypothetical protein
MSNVYFVTAEIRKTKNPDSIKYFFFKNCFCQPNWKLFKN